MFFSKLFKKIKSIFKSGKINDLAKKVDGLANFIFPYVELLAKITETSRDDQFISLVKSYGVVSFVENQAVVLFRKFRDSKYGVKLDAAREIVLMLIELKISNTGAIEIDGKKYSSMKDVTNTFDHTNILTALQTAYELFKLVKKG